MIGGVKRKREKERETDRDRERDRGGEYKAMGGESNR